MRIVTLGGGGASGAPPDLRLGEWILSLAGVERPRVCFVPTASGDDEVSVARFQVAYESLGCRVEVLRLFRRRETDLDRLLRPCHVVFAGGGSTPNLVALWRLHGVDRALRDAAGRGALLAGTSAGAACWFEGTVTDGFGGLQAWRDGLGWLPGSFCPHGDREPERAAAYRAAVASGALPPGVVLDDGVGAHWVGGRLVAVHAPAGGRLAEVG